MRFSLDVNFSRNFFYVVILTFSFKRPCDPEISQDSLPVVRLQFQTERLENKFRFILVIGFVLLKATQLLGGANARLASPVVLVLPIAINVKFIGKNSSYPNIAGKTVSRKNIIRRSRIMPIFLLDKC